MISSENPDNVQTQTGRVTPHELAVPDSELRLDLRQFFEYLYADVYEAVDVQGQFHEIE